MKRLACLAALALVALPATGQERRELGAHQHGVGRLAIAFEGGRIALELRAPGADIVGFEHAAATAGDRAAVDAAVAMLARPLDLFVLPAAAGCSVVSASAGLVGDHEDEGHEHDDHGHEDEDEDHDHEDHAGGHSEFHADYLLACADAGAVNRIEFAYFAVFPNAVEVEVQLVTDSGARAFEVDRDAPVLDLAGLM